MKGNPASSVLALAGFVLGLYYGAWPLLQSYREMTGPPGIFELAVQVLIIGLFGGLGTLLGFTAARLILYLQERSKNH